MYRVLFNTHDEFIEELRKNRLHIDGGIVRTTARKTSSATLPIRHVSYLASAVVCNPPGVQSFVMVLEQYVGPALGNMPGDDPTRQRFNEVGETLESIIEELMLEHRHGMVELAETAK